MKLTRHNGRARQYIAGKNGAYNPKHNDRRFDIENSGHIDADRANQNIYWDCYTGFSSAKIRESDKGNDYSFEKIEQLYYFEHYADHIQAQNERNEKTRYTERNRTVTDLLTNNKTCPEESIYQIGMIDESVSGEMLARIATEFFQKWKKNLVLMYTYWTGHYILMRVLPISMKGMFLTVKINTESCVPNRKKHLKN